MGADAVAVPFNNK